MSQHVLRRRVPLGTGLQANLASLQSNKPRGTIAIQTPSRELSILKNDGDSFIFDSFASDDAWELGNLLQARLRQDTRPALISISLTSGVVVFQATTGPNVLPDNETWVARKRRSVLRWGVSTWLLHCKYNGDEAAFAAKFGMSTEQAGAYAIHGGAIPIRVKGVEGVVAVVIVSGLAQQEDHGVIVDVVMENWEPHKPACIHRFIQWPRHRDDAEPEPFPDPDGLSQAVEVPRASLLAARRQQKEQEEVRQQLAKQELQRDRGVASAAEPETEPEPDPEPEQPGKYRVGYVTAHGTEDGLAEVLASLKPKLIHVFQENAAKARRQKRKFAESG
ncbi:hypothetical protein HK405_010817 [Cladochytrium tenue]|nr:hypothetical protein HK405_010817 [Cladochytrium tenue]